MVKDSPGHILPPPPAALPFSSQVLVPYGEAAANSWERQGGATAFAPWGGVAAKAPALPAAPSWPAPAAALAAPCD